MNFPMRLAAAWIGLLAAGLPALAVGAGAAPPPDIGPTGVSRGGLIFYADLAARPIQPAGTRLDVLVEVPYTSLRFARDASGWVARFEVTAIVYDRGGNQVNGDLWTIPVRSADPNREQAAGRVLRRHFPLIVTEGRLRTDVSVSQTGSGREGKWSRTIDVPRWDGTELVISLPLFGRCDTARAARDSAWSARDSSWAPEFTPVVRRRYGESQPDLCVQGELTDQSNVDAATYRLEWSLLGGGDDTPWGSGALDVPRHDHRGVWLVHPPIDSLTHGTWRLRLLARLGERSTTTEERFEIDESRLNVIDDAEMIRGVLSYIADNSELVALDELPPDSLTTFWDACWLRRDPTPGTAPNENRDEFMRRVEFVNANYGILEPGWRSDMGRIYIRYGPPDQVERVPFTSDGPPHEIWYYTPRNLRFVFVDTEGFGRFRLVGRERR